MSHEVGRHWKQASAWKIYLIFILFVKNPLYLGLRANILVCVSLKSHDLSNIANENIITVYYDAQVIPMVSHFLVIILI